jgi:hypothetical protein
MKRPGRLAALVFATTVGIGGGSALAYWHSSGAGHGSGANGTPSAVTVEAASGTPSSQLIPGGTADLLVQITNPNAYAVTLVSIAANGTVTSTVSACDSGGNGVTVPTQSGLSITIASGSSQLVHVPAGIAMSNASASACQGASFHAPVTITVRR